MEGYSLVKLVTEFGFLAICEDKNQRMQLKKNQEWIQWNVQTY